MLYELSKNSDKTRQIDFAAIERRQTAYEAKRAAIIAQQKAEKAEKAKRVMLFCERWEHALILSDLCKRLADVYCIPCSVNNAALYRLLEIYDWKCTASGVVHSVDKPISLLFVKPLELGGSITINNIKPKYYAGLLAGEWIIRRDNLIHFPPSQAPTPKPTTETQEFLSLAVA